MTKRKLPGATEQTPRRKKQAVTATRSAATKAIIQRNASTSPLLKLPGEIRERIFSLVVGHHLIHLMYLSGLGFRHSICAATTSEDEAYKEFMTGYTNIPSSDSAEYYSITFKERHAHCKDWDLAEGSIWSANPQKLKLDLSILGACRQMYEEANFVLWTTNIFSFDEASSLRNFIGDLHSTQRKKLRCLHINFAWEFLDLDGWGRLLRPSFIRKLSGLQTLHASFDQDFRYKALYLMLLPPHENRRGYDITQPLSRMQMLPLQHATVIFGDDIGGTVTQNRRHRWKVDKKRQVSEALRTKLLDPNGHEVLAAEMKAERAKRDGELREERGRAREAEV